MRCSFYVGAAVVAAPRSLAFHVPPCLTSHGAAAAATAAGSSRRRAGAVAAPSASASGWRWTGAGNAGFCRSRRSGLLLLATSSDSNDGLGRGADRNAGRHPGSPPLQNIPHTSLVLRDEATGCDIYLVGCLHGSHSSGRDVKDVLEEVRPGAVVLELCESRHKALQKDLDKKAKGNLPLEGKERWISVFRSWGKGVQNTSKKAGVLQGALAGLLSAPYLVQRLGDFDPGLEFKTAMVYADASKLSSRPAAAAAGPGECAVVLGDRDVQETLRRLGGALTALTGRRGAGEGAGEKEHGGTRDGSGGGGSGVGGVMGAAATGGVRELDLKAAAASDSYWSALASDWRILQMAVVGPSGKEWPDSLNVFDTVWRERQTLGALVLPLLFGLTVTSEAVQRSIGGAASAITGYAGIGSSDGAAAGFGGLGAFRGKVGGVVGGRGGFAGTSLDVDVGRVLQGAGDVLDTLFVVWTVWYMLRFFRLVIKERDDVLAENVLKACRAHPGRPVVAVLGLLHCNGVADILRNSEGVRGTVKATGGE